MFIKKKKILINITLTNYILANHPKKCHQIRFTVSERYRKWVKNKFPLHVHLDAYEIINNSQTTTIIIIQARSQTPHMFEEAFVYLFIFCVSRAIQPQI